MGAPAPPQRTLSVLLLLGTASLRGAAAYGCPDPAAENYDPATPALARLPNLPPPAVAP